MQAGGTDDGPQLLAFQIGGRDSGCPLSDVREIIPWRPTTRIPGAPPHVLGLLNLRGTLLTVLDVGIATGSPIAPSTGAASPAQGRGHVLVVETEGRSVGCRVDMVRRVYPLAELLSTPQVGNSMPHGIVLGMGDAGGAIVTVLDLPALVRKTLLLPGER